MGDAENPLTCYGVSMTWCSFRTPIYYYLGNILCAAWYHSLCAYDTNNDIEFSIKIGKDEAGIDNCAVISAKYSVNGKEIGRAGVIGPMRMDYGKVVAVLNHVCRTLDEILKNS